MEATTLSFQAGDRFAARHSIHGLRLGIVMRVSAPGEFVYPQVQVRWDGENVWSFFGQIKCV